MNHEMPRRRFLGLIPAAAFATVPGVAFAGENSQPEEGAVYASFPAQKAEMVQAMVMACHGDVAKVKDLLSKSPDLAKSGWDWGFGDWETAIGAASHTGQREIAQMLMDNGARPDIFTYVMMGQLDAVKAMVAAQPGVQRILGPHGITMLTHAKIAGEPAKAVAEYLQSLGDADMKAKSLPVTDEEKAMYVGVYRFGKGTEDTLEVMQNKAKALTIRRGTQQGRGIHRVEDHGFAASGAPGVRIRFLVENGKAVAVSVHDPEPIVIAARS